MRRLCIIFLLLSFVPVSFGQLEGSLSGTRGPGTLSVDDTIYIDAGDTLILVHGTTLDFRGPFPFYINGTILAKGTDPEPVIFTTDTIDFPQRWRGLRFSSSSRACSLAFCRIENSRASGAWPDSSGGGAYCRGSPTFYYCTIRHNIAGLEGGGVCCDRSSPKFINCTISDNRTGGKGGGVLCASATPTFTNCAIIRNSSVKQGGGVYNGGSTTVFLNCTISDNLVGTGYDGGGVYNINSAADFSRCIISGNSSSRFGGAVHIQDSSPTLTRCTLSNNSADSLGGAIFSIASSPVISSTIIAFSEGEGIYFDSDGSESRIEYCDFFENSGGNIVGEGPIIIGLFITTNINGDSCDTYLNISEDPMFIDASAGIFYLQLSSPCIDAGDPNLPYDIDGTVCEMGPFSIDQGSRPPFDFLLVSPPWGTHLTENTVLTWETAIDTNTNDTVRYEVWMDTLGNLSTAREIASGLAFPFYQPTGLPESYSYYWTVHASDIGTPGTWASDTLMFHTYPPEPPASFALTKPADSSQLSFGGIEFCWEAARDPDPWDTVDYTLRIATVDTSLTFVVGFETCLIIDVGALELPQGLSTEWWVEAHSHRPDTIIESIPRFMFSPPIVEPVPDEYALHQNYPNPFNPTTVIRYDVKETGLVSLKIYNLLGGEVAVLVRRTVQPGFYRIVWDATNFSSGVYLCRMEAPGFMQTRKLVLVK